jgi:hypothetical protein
VKQRPPSVPNVLIPRKHPRNSLSSCYTLLVQINASNILIPTSISQNPSVNFEIIMVSSLGSAPQLQERFVSNFNGIIECEILIMEVQRLKDIFSIVYMHLCAYLNTLESMANGVCAE